MENDSCEAKVVNFEKCLKSCFDTVERKISARAFDPAKKILIYKTILTFSWQNNGKL